MRKPHAVILALLLVVAAFFALGGVAGAEHPCASESCCDHSSYGAGCPLEKILGKLCDHYPGSCDLWPPCHPCPYPG